MQSNWTKKWVSNGTIRPFAELRCSLKNITTRTANSSAKVRHEQDETSRSNRAAYARSVAWPQRTSVRCVRPAGRSRRQLSGPCGNRDAGAGVSQYLDSTRRIVRAQKHRRVGRFNPAKT